jgi:general secretion pathway protein A
MYTAFHNLTKKPFSMTADPFFLFVTKQHREALVGLTYAVLDRKGFLVLSGMAGSGKTTLLSWVLERLSCDNLRSSVILNPTLTREEFLEMVMLDFGITNIPASKAQRLWVLQNFLLAGTKEGKVNVLIVDEAHKLSYELLEEIRFLGNLEYGQEKLLQILLLGQSELDEILNRPELWQLKQRISVRLSIGSLASNEVEHYIQHRWTLAGGQQHPFSPESVEHIRRWSNGVPRLINALCDNSLTQAFADESRTVTSVHVDAAAEDLLLKEKPRALQKSAAVAMAGATAPAATEPAPHVDHTPPVPPLRPMLVVAPPVSSQTAPGTGISVLAVQNHAPKPRRRSIFSRWAEKLGLNGYGRI